MATLTINREQDSRMKWFTYKVRVDGHDFMGITDETGAEAVKRLEAIARPRADLILELILAANERREWNMQQLKAGGQGRDWPAFRNLERMRNRLLKEAGIKDT